MIKILYYLDHAQLHPVYQTPNDGKCPFCGKDITIGIATYQGAPLDGCTGCRHMFDMGVGE